MTCVFRPQQSTLSLQKLVRRDQLAETGKIVFIALNFVEFFIEKESNYPVTAANLCEKYVICARSYYGA